MKRFTAVCLGALLMGQMPALLLANDMGDHKGMEMGMMDKGKMGEEMVSHRVDFLSKKLDLTADQKDKLKGVLTDEMNQMKPLHDQMMSIHKATDEKISGLLNDDQKKKFSELRDMQKERMQKRMDKMHDRMENKAPAK